MAYVTPGTVAAGDVATAAAWNVITNDVIAIRDTQKNFGTAIKTDVQSGSVGAGGSLVITGLSCSITPSSATSKILVLAQISVRNETQINRSAVTLRRDGATITAATGDAASTRTRVTSSGSGGDTNPGTIPIMFIDSPATTSAVAYTVSVQNLDTSTQTLNINKGANADSDNVAAARTISTIFAMELVL